jgi:hypothetical protein
MLIRVHPPRADKFMCFADNTHPCFPSREGTIFIRVASPPAADKFVVQFGLCRARNSS